MTDELLRALGRRQGQVPTSVTTEPGHPVATEAAEATHPDAEEALRPFTGDERDALLDDVFAAVDAERSAGKPDKADASPAGEADETAATPIDLGARRGARMRTVVAVVAAIAAAVLLFLFVRGPGGDPVRPSVASLPSFEITRLKGGIAKVRDQPEAVPSRVELRPDATIDWIMTPQRPTRERLVLFVIATPDGGEPQLFAPQGVVFVEGGVARLQGRLDELLGLPDGEWTIELVVAPAKGAPRTVEDARAGGFPTDSFRATIAPE